GRTDSAAAARLTVVRALPEPVQPLAGLAHDLRLVLGIHEVLERFAVDLARDLLRRRRRRDRVLPGEIQDGVRKRAALLSIELAQLQENAGHDLEVRLGLARWIGALPVPLQPSAAVHQRAVF